MAMVTKRRPDRLGAKVAIACVVFGLLASGCSIIGAMLTTRSALSGAGWSVGSVDIHSGIGEGRFGTLFVSVGYRQALAQNDPQHESQVVARVVWDNTPGHFSSLNVTVTGVPFAALPGAGTTVYPAPTYSHSQLAALFGPRPNGLDAHPIVSAGALVHTVELAAVVAGAIVVLAVVLVLAVVIWRRRAYRAPRPMLASPYRAVASPGWQGYAHSHVYPVSPHPAPTEPAPAPAPASEESGPSR